MRVLMLILTFLAVPAIVSAQQAGDLEADLVPDVQLQETTQQVTAPPASVEMDEADTEPVTAERGVDADETAIQQGPRSTSWWWLVGAIVVGGIILAVLL